MIDKIVIKNFQSHKRTVLNLDKGINGIIGKPNSGKTAIIRAILLLKNNRPSGFAYHNDLVKSPKTEVHIKPDNSPVLKFKKAKSKATYFRGNKKYNPGKSVPDVITSSLNLDDINFGLQLGMPFLIMSTPSEIAKQINKIAESEVINKCIKLTNEIMSKLKSKRKSLKLDIDDLKTKLSPLKNIDRVKPLIDKATKYDLKIEGIYLKIDELKEIKSFITKARIAIKNQQKPLAALELIKKAETLQYKMEGIASEMTMLENIKRLKVSLNLAVEEKHKVIEDYTNELKRSKECPTCFQPIKNKTIEHIWKELNQ